MAWATPPENPPLPDTAEFWPHIGNSAELNGPNGVLWPKMGLLGNSVLTPDDEYRRNAADAQTFADRARTDVDRAAWLRVVQGWLSLIRSRQPEDDVFEARATALGTGQEPPREAH